MGGVTLATGWGGKHAVARASREMVGNCTAIHKITWGGDDPVPRSSGFEMKCILGAILAGRRRRSTLAKD